MWRSNVYLANNYRVKSKQKEGKKEERLAGKEDKKGIIYKMTKRKKRKHKMFQKMWDIISTISIMTQNSM